MGVADDLVRTALLAALVEPDELPPGEHEIRCGVESVASDFHSAFGLHGRLTVKPAAIPLQDLLQTAVGLLIAAVPEGHRAQLLRELPKLAAAGDCPGGHLRTARKLLRDLKRKTGVSWQDTPSYKPKV